MWVKSFPNIVRQLLPHLLYKHVVLPFIEKYTQDANYNGGVDMDSYHLEHTSY